MSIPKELIITLNNFSSKQSLSKNDKNFIKDNLIFLKNHVNRNELEIINPVIKSLENGRLTVIDKDIIIQNKKSVIKIINKYEEEFNDESNTGDINVVKSVDDIEHELDSKIKKYNGFSENHPMQGISYLENKQKWRIQTDTINTTTKKLNIATQKIIDSINVGKIETNSVKKFFNYKNHYFIIYWNNDNPLFDIQHIISVLNLKTTSYTEKYNEFSNQITNYIWYKNEFDGYILRELIPETTVFEIILSSNSIISKSFKKDVSEILSDLRKDGDLIITNDTISAKKLKKHANVDEGKDVVIKNMIKNDLSLSYDNPADMMQLYILINQMSFVPISQFIDQSVLYASIVSLKRNHNKVIVKFGWTLDILSRIKKLQSEYGSNFYLIGLKRVKNEPIEKQFHKILALKYPDSIESVKISGKDKVELYKFNLLMMSEFNAIEEDNTKNIQDIILNDEQKILVSSIGHQNTIFQNIIMSQLNMNNIMSKTTDANVINNCAILHYNFLTIQSNNTYEQTIRKMQFDADNVAKEFKIKELEIRKEIKLQKLKIRSKELDVECYKMKHSKK